MYSPSAEFLAHCPPLLYGMSIGSFPGQLRTLPFFHSLPKPLEPQSNSLIFLRLISLQLHLSVMASTTQDSALSEHKQNTHSLVDSKFPIFLPPSSALYVAKDEFQDLVRSRIKSVPPKASSSSEDTIKAFTTLTVGSGPTQTSQTEEQGNGGGNAGPEVDESFGHPFLKGLAAQNEKNKTPPPPDLAAENKMLTEKADVAFRSSTSSLVDLFYELEDVVSGERLKQLLDAAWAVDAAATLKIIWNARSIHLGKSSRATFYRCYGWLAQNHPMTALTNLDWLSRPVIQKKVDKSDKKEGRDDDLVLVDARDASGHQATDWDVRNGVAHGYWKDLLNILALAANGELRCEGDPSKVLNITIPQKGRNWDHDSARDIRHNKQEKHNEEVLKKFESDGFYWALHLTVTRLFADQLEKDKALLDSDDKKDLRKVSLAAKWAPSPKRAHDKHTSICSTLAECLYPVESISQGDKMKDRETYVRHAREE